MNSFFSPPRRVRWASTPRETISSDAAAAGPAEKEAPGGGVVRRPRLHRLLPLPRNELRRGDADGARRMDTGQFASWHLRVNPIIDSKIEDNVALNNKFPCIQ